MKGEGNDAKLQTKREKEKMHETKNAHDPQHLLSAHLPMKGI